MDRTSALGRIENARIAGYHTVLREPYRPPSRGGNTSALHSHYLNIEGQVYSFAAPGSRRWVYKSDTVSFDYETVGGYKNIVKETLRVINRQGQEVVRGNHRFKRRLRSAPAGLPVSRREARD